VLQTGERICPIDDRLREHGAVSLDGTEWFEKADLGPFDVFQKSLDPQTTLHMYSILYTMYYTR
jgi:hypothetical protein